MYLVISVVAYILLCTARSGVTSPLKDTNQLFENLRNKDGIIDSIPASLFPTLQPSKDIDSEISKRSEEPVSPVLRFFITTKTTTVTTTVATVTSLSSSWSTCYSSEANIVSCTPTVGQVTVGTGRKRRESLDESSYPSNRPIATLNGNYIDFNDLISPSRVSRQNDVDATVNSNDDKADKKDGRARIVDPPRYEEVGISGFVKLGGDCNKAENGVDNKNGAEAQQPRFITIHSTSTASVTATTTNTAIQAAKQTVFFIALEDAFRSSLS